MAGNYVERDGLKKKKCHFPGYYSTAEPRNVIKSEPSDKLLSEKNNNEIRRSIFPFLWIRR